MVHQYKNNGYNMVLDVASGSVHVVDDLTYEVIALYEDHTLEEIIKELSSWDEKDVKESYGEVTELKDAGVLFTEDCYEEYICGFKDRPTVVKALCLHIAHDCNLACRYCFAEEGEYKGRRALMSAEVGKKALDFLVENSGNRRNLEVDFFGGEPLMNFDVVKEIVAYGRSLEETHDKKFRFTLTTNGVLLNDDIMEFANKEMDNVVLSVDGRKEVHDYMRPFRNGKGSYDFVIDKFKKLERKADLINSITVTLAVNKLDQIAKADIAVNGGNIHAEATDESMYSAVDALIDKVDRQIVKYKEKVKND